MKENDVNLIRQIIAGDDTAFVRLVEKYQKQIHALAWRKIGDFHIAEEITQDTFLKAYQKLSTLRDPNQFSGWLYVIANRQCLAWLRKKRIETESLEDTDTEWIDETTYSQYVAEEQAKVTVETQREVVKKLLSKLKESERTVMTLYYLGEMTTEEISQFLGVSTSAIKLRLHRARQKLQKEETMIREALSNFKLSPNLTDNIMQKVEHIKPAAPSGSKPLVPWAVAVSMLVVMLLMLGFGNHRYLARFQKPYSFDATSEMVVEIIDAPIVANLESKPDVRTQIGNVNALNKHNNSKQQPNDASAAVEEEQTEETMKDYTQWALPEKAKARLGKGGINVMQFSPDGTLLAVGSDIGLWLYDAKTGKEVSMFPGKYESIAFSPDGHFLAGSIGGSRRKGNRLFAVGLQLWEVATGQKMQLTPRLFPHALVLQFSADGKTLFGLDDVWGTIFLRLDVETGKRMLKRITEDQTPTIVDHRYYALTHDKFAVGMGTEIELRDTTTGEIPGKILFTLKGNTSLLALEFSPDGTRLASAGENNDETFTLQLWDTNSNESILLDKHAKKVDVLAFSSDGKMLASGGRRKAEQTVLLWDVATGEPITTFTGHAGGIIALTFSPDNRILAGATTMGTVRFWNIKNGNLLPTCITGHTMEVEAATFFKDNTTLASVAYDEVISLWDVKTSQKTGSNALQTTDFYLERRQPGLSSFSTFSPDGTKLVSFREKGNRTFPDAPIKWDEPLVRLSDVRTGDELQTLAAKKGFFSPVTFSPDGKMVAFSNSGKIRLWNTETGEISDISLPDISPSYQNVKRKRKHKRKFKSTISTLVFSPDGKKLVSGTKGGKVQMWDAKTGVPLALLFTGEEPVFSGKTDNSGILYKESIKTLAFSPNGNLLVVATHKQIRLIEIKEQITFKEVSQGAKTFIAEVFVFSPDNRILVAGLNYGGIKLWDTETGDRLTILDGHTAPVKTLVFSPDGKTLMSTGQDGAILLWDWDEVIKGSNRKENK